MAAFGDPALPDTINLLKMTTPITLLTKLLRMFSDDPLQNRIWSMVVMKALKIILLNPCT